MSALHSRFNGHTHRRIKTILCLGEGERVGDFDQLLEQVDVPVHSHLRGCFGNSSLFRGDIRRMAREISGRLVGLALASGGAKGFAHIGVLQVLEENGIEVDVIAGSSMGAYVGSIWAYGASGAEMERLAREMEQRWAIWGLIDPAFPPRRGFLRGAAIKQRLMRTIGESHFGDLVRPLRVVATNLETLDRVVFSQGRVADAVHASIAVPGICVPVVVGHDTFADGGIVDPLPVEVLREAGASRVIAVNTIPTTERMRQALQTRRARARENGHRAKENSDKILPFDEHLNYFARGNILEILMRSFLGVQTRMAETSCLHADLVLRPDIEDNRWVDFRNPDKYILAGRSIALKQLDEIKALMRISRNGVVHEAEPVKEPLAAVG
jgi:NTE family protein